MPGPDDFDEQNDPDPDDIDEYEVEEGDYDQGLKEEDMGDVRREIDPDTDSPETKFRETVRDILGLSPFDRAEKIFDEIRRLKRIEERMNDKFCQPDSGIVIERA